MKEKYPYSDPSGGTLHDSFFRHARVPYRRSREQVWEELEQKMGEAPGSRVLRLRTYRWIAAAAAVMILLLGTFLVLRFYTTTARTGPGTQMACTLPDGSTVELNAGSALSYHPFWWRFGREVRFEGEGYFEVVKGSKFSVASTRGTTSVLGTRFNIYSREEDYRVTCFSGSVRVTSGTGQAAILSPEYQAEVLSDGKIKVSKETLPGAASSWMDGMFRFESQPLRQVFNEIERQYSVNIRFGPSSEYLYTGFFSREKPVEEVLGLVCKPFGLTFAMKSEKTYEVFPNE